MTSCDLKGFQNEYIILIYAFSFLLIFKMYFFKIKTLKSFN